MENQKNVEMAKENSFAIELTKSIVAVNRRLIALVAVLIALLAITNMAWLYAWNQYDYIDVTVDSGEGNGDAIYQSGEGNVANGQSESANETEN